MFGMWTLDRHENRTRKMAEILGLDIEKALIYGTLSRVEFRGAAVSCIRCSKPYDCKVWLQAHGDGADAPPANCRIATFLDRLKKLELSAAAGNGSARTARRPPATLNPPPGAA